MTELYIKIEQDNKTQKEEIRKLHRKMEEHQEDNEKENRKSNILVLGIISIETNDEGIRQEGTVKIIKKDVKLDTKI